jgi:hypothetical protein
MIGRAEELIDLVEREIPQTPEEADHMIGMAIAYTLFEIRSVLEAIEENMRRGDV